MGDYRLYDEHTPTEVRGVCRNALLPEFVAWTLDYDTPRRRGTEKSCGSPLGASVPRGLGASGPRCVVIVDSSGVPAAEERRQGVPGDRGAKGILASAEGTPSRRSGRLGRP